MSHNLIKDGVCPVCNGTTRVAADDQDRKYAHITVGYDADTDTMPCRNCGGQYMMGRPTGRVFLRRDNGEPCTHSYEHTLAGRCYHRYTCRFCPDTYYIDSGD